MRCIPAIVLAALVVAVPAAVARAETRCGWLENPSPANLVLIDKDDIWWITSQGQAKGPNAEGNETNLPRISERNIVRRGSANYTCVCLDVDTDAAKARIIRVNSGKALALRVCHRDKSLPKMEY